jgi:predicted nucleic acid-binding protein
MTIHVIDTNIVLRFLLADQPEHFERAKALLAEVQAGKRRAYLPESVLAECIFVLTKFYKVPKQEAAARLGELLDYKGFRGDHLAVLKGALAIFTAQKIAFVDAIVLATTRHNGWHMETFDRTLSKLAAKQ